MTTDWQSLPACASCPAVRAEPCYRLSSGGPEALPPQYADRPHPSRKTAGQSKPAAPRTPGTARKPTARRAQSTNDRLVKAWQAAAGRKGSA